MRFSSYTKYRPSEIEWLGDIPEHWELSPLYTRYTIELGKMLDESRMSGNHLVPYLRNVDVQWDVINTDDLPEMDIRTDEYRRYTLREGDLLVCEGGEVGRAAIFPRVDLVLGFQKALHRLRAIDGQEVPRFLYYTLRWAAEYGVFLAEGNPNTIPHLTGEKLRRYRFPKPPVCEQHTIADFLDAETAKLDTLVAKKRELIEKLKEKRSALISRTVTRGLPPEASRSAGLDPNPKLKPSGIEWLGEIPEHWDSVPLGYLVQFRGGATPDKGNAEYWEGPIPWVSPKDMKQPYIADVEDHISEEALRNSPLTMIPVNAVLIVVRGMILAHSFPVALVEAPVTINQDMKALLCKKTLEPRFLFWALTGYGKIFVSFADESAHGTRKIETPILSRFPFSFPSSAEQRAIADYLDRETNKIDRMVAKVEEAIERLQEYRTALITAAVTGKIDVRGYAPATEAA